MFLDATRYWVKELQQKGKLHDKSPDELEKLAVELSVKLEEYYYEQIRDQMEKLDKSAELERMILYDTQYLSKYLNQTLPAFPALKYEIFEKAKKNSWVKNRRHAHSGSQSEQTCRKRIAGRGGFETRPGAWIKRQCLKSTQSGRSQGSPLRCGTTLEGNNNGCPNCKGACSSYIIIPLCLSISLCLCPFYNVGANLVFARVRGSMVLPENQRSRVITRAGGLGII
jgi:hypothetical protein